jgi:hypothetical protein
MFFLDADGSLYIVFSPSSTLDELYADLEDAIDGHSVLQQAYLILNPHLPSTYFDGASILDSFLAASILLLFAGVHAALEANFYLQIERDLFVFAYLAFKFLVSGALLDG